MRERGATPTPDSDHCITFWERLAVIHTYLAPHVFLSLWNRGCFHVSHSPLGVMCLSPTVSPRHNHVTDGPERLSSTWGQRETEADRHTVYKYQAYTGKMFQSCEHDHVTKPQPTKTIFLWQLQIMLRCCTRFLIHRPNIRCHRGQSRITTSSADLQSPAATVASILPQASVKPFGDRSYKPDSAGWACQWKWRKLELNCAAPRLPSHTADKTGQGRRALREALGAHWETHYNSNTSVIRAD